MQCTRTDHGSETTLTIVGTLDAANVTSFRPVIDALIAEPAAERVVVAIGALEMIDSSGIGVLVSLVKQLRAQNRSLRVADAGGQPLMVIKLLKLETLFGIA